MEGSLKLGEAARRPAGARAETAETAETRRMMIVLQVDESRGRLNTLDAAARGRRDGLRARRAAEQGRALRREVRRLADLPSEGGEGRSRPLHNVRYALTVSP